VNDHMPIYVGDQAIEKFIQFCREKGFDRYYLIADENTFKVLGERVLAAIQAQGWDVLHQVLNPEHLHTDDFSITRVFATYDAQPRLFVAVGSGTITDITRFTSHRSRNPFVSFPTAASVDAYTSKNAPATVGGLKGSIYCHAPIAIFTDLPTICESPRFLTASGFGDSISKFTSSTDWKFTNLIWGSPIDEDIYRHALHAARQSAAEVQGIHRSAPESMAKLMDSQFESGFCMADFANSAPASGGEHHIAHLWEMMYHWEGRDGLFHGNAVGVAVIIEAEWFERLRALSKADAETLLKQAAVPEKAAQIKAMEKHVPLIAGELIHGNPIYLQLADPALLARCSGRMLAHWDEIQSIAANVPTAEQVRTWLKLLGAPTTAQELGVTQEQVQIAKDYGLYLRERFSMNIIRKLFGWN
jgi:glycerol-1-phosphate dehydrogenase [NAD(P)+]